jgi:hypothetical protein
LPIACSAPANDCFGEQDAGVSSLFDSSRVIRREEARRDGVPARVIGEVATTGILVFVYAAGRVALRGVLSRRLAGSGLARHVLAIVAGVALLTPALVLLAAAGWFRTSWIGAAGWAASGIIFCVWRGGPAESPARFGVAELIVSLAALAFVGIATIGRDETLGAGRDQQVYAQFAIALSEHGTFGVRYAPIDRADAALLRQGYRQEACTAYAFKSRHAEHRQSPFVVPGGVNACNGVDSPIGLLHPSGWPVWLAVAHGMLGIEGVYAANAVVFALGGMIFFLLARLVSGAVIAGAATLLLLALPSSLWIAGISLSEPLAMMLLLAIPLFVATARGTGRRLVGALFVAAVLVRVDSIVAAPIVMAAVLVATLRRPTTGVIAAARRALLALLTLLGLVFVAYAILFPRYLEATLDLFALTITAAGVLTLASMALTPTIAARIGVAIDSRSARVAALSILALLFAYAVAIRPGLEPFATIVRGMSVHPVRDFREDSLRNLTAYLSWPLVVTALLGLGWAIGKGWSSRRDPLRPLVLLFGLVPALLYLWSPSVSADHPWAFRRFVPLVVPYALVFAALLVHAWTRRAGWVGTAVGALALLCVPGAILLDRYPARVLLLRENDGLTRQIADIAAQLPEGLTVASDVEQDIGSALLVAFGKPVAVSDGGLHPEGDPTAITQWIEAKAVEGHPAWLLHPPETWRTGARWSDEKSWWVTRDVIVPSVKPPATTIEKRSVEIVLSRVDGLDRTFASRMFGAERIWGVTESGFFGTEVASFGMLRYTNGDAWLDVPAAPLREADALKVDVFTFAREGAQRWLRIGVGARTAWEGKVPAGLASIRAPIPELPPEDTVRISIQSEHADRGDMGADDPRVGLSVGLIGIRPVRKEEATNAAFAAEAFCAALAGISVGPGEIRMKQSESTSIVADVTNCGDLAWRDARDPAVLAAGSTQIALRWHERAEPHRIVADDRRPLSVTLLSSDRTRIRLPLQPVGRDGKPLRAGAYDVGIEVVHEPGGEIAHGAGPALSIPVVIGGAESSSGDRAR